MSYQWNLVEEYKEQLQNGEAIVSIWIVDDVLLVDETLSREEAVEVLERVSENFDEKVGINLSVIDKEIRLYKEDKEYD